jgi:hypothetical protein
MHYKGHIIDQNNQTTTNLIYGMNKLCLMEIIKILFGELY